MVYDLIKFHQCTSHRCRDLIEKVVLNVFWLKLSQFLLNFSTIREAGEEFFDSLARTNIGKSILTHYII